eukprot:TRINITY_DN56547_c0_g1_i1.p1 TRINITY_DN56547_c0_g1~~TRINITY_DN56547_c0_g1_i1.p1  ORF type:complete len:444 (+),score=57.44 TRINITY_DN56547_c0_g1_i1:99-1430(+)
MHLVFALQVTACLSYKAAYVEHHAVSPCGSGTCGGQQQTSSLKSYDKYAAEAAWKGAQIIVFPEYGITGFGSGPKSSWKRGGYTVSIPDKVGYVPCDNADEFRDAASVVSLSCTAKKYGIAIVANLMEYTSSGKMWNTDVALDSDGKYLAKYHKRNLWGEFNVDTPPLEHVTFTTKFGETFGMLVCADLIYAHPALDLVKTGVKNFVAPIAWSNEMPHMQPMAYAQGWSLANQVNLVISNHRTASMSGSGIFVSGYPVSQVYDPANKAGAVEVAMVSTQVVTSSRPKPLARFSLSKLAFSWQFGSLGSRICHRDVCCSAIVTAGSADGYVLAFLDGIDENSGMRWRAQVCAVLPCTKAGSSCLDFQMPSGNLTGVSVEMSGSNIVPEVLGYEGGLEVLLTPGDELHFERNKSRAFVDVRSRVTLISAILYGRPTEDDGEVKII